MSVVPLLLRPQYLIAAEAHPVMLGSYEIELCGNLGDGVI